MKKNRLKFRKTDRSVWFRFYNPKTKKTKPNRTQTEKKGKKSQTGKKPSQTEKTESNRFLS